MLTGIEIQNEIEMGNITIKPFDKKFINPNSYNLHLGSNILVYDCDYLDIKKENPTKKLIIPEDGLILEPGVLYLATTEEYTETDKYVPMLNGRSSIGRLGLTIHVTAGFGDVGFKGKWTLEIFCIKPVKVYPNMEICQICYFPAIGSTDIKYNGKYMNQDDVTSSRLYREY